MAEYSAQVNNSIWQTP